MDVKILNNQLYILLSFFTTGIVIGIIFDMFRVTRKAFKMPNILIYIEDALFWILAGFVLLFTICTFTDGQIRLYMILILILGALIYFITISKWFIRINTKIFNLIKHFCELLLLPVKKMIEFSKKIKIFSKNSGK